MKIKTKEKMKVRDIILISMFAALTAVGAFIRIPTPLVPFTLQFVFCAYAGIFLGAKHGLYSQLLYVGIGLIGIPIFTNGGGVTYIFQPTFGYLIGFILCAFIIGKLTENLKEIKLWRVLVAVLVGLSFVYLLGVSYLYMIVNLYLGKAMTIKAAILSGVIPYVTSDVILSILVSLTAIKVIPILRKTGLTKAIVK